VSIGRERRVLTPVKRATVIGAAVLFGAAVLAPSPGSADPNGGSGGSSDSSSADGPLTLSEAQARVDALNHQAEIASEQMNTIKVQMKAAHQRLRSFQADLHRQTVVVDALRHQLIGSALSKYQSGSGLSTSTGFLVAKNPQSYLAGLSESAVADNEQAGLFAHLTEQQRRLSVQQGQAKSELDAIAKAKSDLADEQAELDKKSNAAQAILDKLTLEQQQRLAALAAAASSSSSSSSSSTQVSRSTPRVHDIPASGRAEVAVQTALAQVGDPYVYGAAGPDAFDCSGLTMYSWAAAGVSLSHSSSVQAGTGTQVSLSDLMPGDLIFYYSPISHVAMYIGHGMIVHAPHPGENVQVVSMYEMPIAEARRVG
jgi:cell wall-associated NlpC family hydrolase